MNCKQNSQIISLEYSRNMGLTWQLVKYYIFNMNQSYIIHEDLLDEMKYDYVLIRFVFLSNNRECLKLEQVGYRKILNLFGFYSFWIDYR